MASVVTKSDLVQVAAKAGNVSKAAAGDAVNALFDAIVQNVAKGNRVTVVGFGTFLPRRRKARAGRSPVNGKEIKINAKTLPVVMSGFITDKGTQWDQMTALGVITVLPVLVFALVVQRYLVRGLTLGAVKE